MENLSNVLRAVIVNLHSIYRSYNLSSITVLCFAVSGIAGTAAAVGVLHKGACLKLICFHHQVAKMWWLPPVEIKD